MLRRDNRIAVVLSLLCFLMAWTASAAEVLVKIHLDDAGKLTGLAAEKYTVRFRGKSFLLVQGDEEQFAELSTPYMALDKIKPDAVYYLVRVGRTGSHLSQLEKLGDVLLRFGDSALLCIAPSKEPGLISLGLPLAPLPEKIRMYPQKKVWTAPRLRSQVEAAFDVAVISDIVSAVSTDEVREAIYELQENRDLDPPHTAYRSRYCLRVKETDDPSDDACDNAAEYIFNRFRDYGLDVEYDSFPHEVLTQGHYQMRNVVATLPGKGVNSERTYVICAHYDSIASKSTNWLLDWRTMPAPGADDNASGTVAVLEAARVLSQYDFDSTIKFITFSGEELGLHGSEHYTKLAAERGEDIAGVLNFDMIAYDPDDLDIDIITNAASEWLSEAMLSVQEMYNIGPLILKKIVNPEMVYSDHSPFWSNGWNAILGIDNSDFDSPEFYPSMHTTDDTIDKLNFEMASRMVQVAVGTLASLADPIDGMAYPDLAVTDDDIYLSSETPQRGQLVQAIAHIHNLGEADAEGARVQVWLLEPLADAPHLIEPEEMVDVSAGGSAQVSVSLRLTEWGEHRLLVIVNPGYQIFETDGRNNTASKAIRVGSTSLALGELMLYPNPVRFTTGDNLNIAYSLSKDASIELRIYNASGDLIYESSFDSGEPGGKSGPNKGIQWDGTNLSGRKVASGIYVCVVTANEPDTTESVLEKFFIIR